MFFVAEHTWKAKDFMTVGKKILGVLSKLPEGVALCSSYVHDTGGWCVYSAESMDAGAKVQAFLTAAAPEATTKVTPVLQFFPPSPDIYPLIAKIMDAVA